MKFSLAVVLLAVLAIGAQSAVLVKREIPSELEGIHKIIQDVSASITNTAQEMVEMVKAHEMTNKAQTYIEGGTAQLQPLAETIHTEAGKLQDNLQAQVKPLMVDFQAQMEQLLKQVLAQTKAMLPPQ